MLHRSRLILICLMVLLCPLPLNAGTVSSELFNRAENYYSAGRYLEALSFYRDSVSNSKTAEHKSAALFGMALLYDLYLDCPEQALASYKNCIELNGEDSARALHYSARILMRQSRFADAQAFYKKVLMNYAAYSSAHGVGSELEQSSAGPAEGMGLFDRKHIASLSGTVRVLIEDSPESIVIKGNSGLCNALHAEEQFIEYPDDALVIQADNNSLFVNNVAHKNQTLIVRSDAEKYLEVNSRQYRSFVTVRARQGRLQVINHVPLDHYLYGVLPREVYVSWPSAVLKAQAVAARTYVLYHMLVRQGSSYDVLSTTSSQVYGGVAREHPATNSAVDATSGLVLFNDRQLALTLYNANSGGVVEAVEDVWGARLPYLRRVVDTASLQARHARWSCVLSVADIIDRLSGYGLQCVGLNEIKVSKRSAGGRVQQIILKGKGLHVLVGGNTLRLMLGPSVVKSTRFIIKQSGGIFTFTGTGYGHGVGMSQWGAYMLAKKRTDYKAILAHYYPGTQIVALKSLTANEAE